MYKVAMKSPTYGDKVVTLHGDGGDATLISGKLKIEVNKAGSFDFTMGPDHPAYFVPELIRTEVTVYNGTSVLWRGYPVSITTDFYKRKTVKCEGVLAYLSDSVLFPEVYEGTVGGFFTQSLASHNAAMSSDTKKQFLQGDLDNSARFLDYSVTTNCDTTWKYLSQMAKEIGAYMTARIAPAYQQDEALYLDFVTKDTILASGNVASQTVTLGQNLIDMMIEQSVEESGTAIIPLGSTIAGMRVDGQRLDLRSAQNPTGSLLTGEHVKYGYIYKTVIFDGATSPQKLTAQAQQYITSQIYDKTCIEVTAFDLSLAEEAMEAFRLLDVVTVQSGPHDINVRLIITKMQVDVVDPKKNKITLGDQIDRTISGNAERSK